MFTRLPGAILALLLGLAAAGQPRLARAASAEGPCFELLSSVHARFDQKGNLSLVAEGIDGEILYLGTHRENTGNPGRTTSQWPVFAAVTSEGAAHGLRGFSAGSDDDQDGKIDEDRLDGRDNDGDGLIDEDYAAIGDTMAVWDGAVAGGAIHREFYHWVGDSSRSILFFTADSRPRTSTAGTILLQADYPWVPVDVSSLHHKLAGSPEILYTHAMVTAVGEAGENAPETWIGFLILGPKGLDRVHTAELGTLEVNPAAGPVVGAVVVARSWMQLSSRLCEATQVYRGVTDPVTGKQARWIVSPSCTLCRKAKSPSLVWQSSATGGGTLTMVAAWGGARFPDPDLMTIDGAPLASPEEILWRGWDGRTRRTPWFRYRFQDLLRMKPAPEPLWKTFPPLAGHAKTQSLQFRFDRTPPMLGEGEPRPSSEKLAALALDGRPWSGRLILASPAVDGGDTHASSFTSRENDQPVLSQRLMLGWPNPFRERIQIRCLVPTDSREAFDPAPELIRATVQDKTYPALPWGEGEPAVSVKIYGINGQEIRTLYSGRQGAGTFMVQWDGTDSYGRPVASGPYLCKLQLDDLSVTRRLVYLR